MKFNVTIVQRQIYRNNLVQSLILYIRYYKCSMKKCIHSHLYNNNYEQMYKLTAVARQLRRKESRSPPSISSMMINCGSLSKQTPSKLSMCSWRKFFISRASFRNSSFSCSDALLRNVWKKEEILDFSGFLNLKIIQSFQNLIMVNNLSKSVIDSLFNIDYLLKP